MGLVRLDLAPQIEDVYVDRAVKALEVVTEDFFDQLGAAENAIRFANQNAQQLEFDRGQVEWFPLQQCFMLQEIDREVARFDLGRSRLQGILRQAAKDCPDPGDQLFGTEGFTDIVVGPQVHAIVPYAVDHRGVTSVGYALVEEIRRGRFNPELARELGIPEGPLWGRIHKGESITLDDGRVIEPATLVGPTRPGRRVVISGDTRPCGTTIEMAQGADLLVHESTFGEEEAERAVETGHSTAREAAQVALGAGVRQLLLTHFSARYSRDPSDLDREAREVFPRVTIARDGMEISVPFADEEADA